MPKKERREHSRAAGKGIGEISRRKLNEYSIDERKSDFDNSDWKYEPREITSNWDKYRPKSPDVARDDSPDKLGVSDFAELLTSSSDCNYFQFKSEKNWDAEVDGNSFGNSSLFTLDVELLASGLACIPFYERVSIDKSILSQADIERCDKEAEESAARYKIVLNKFLEKMKQNDALEDLGKTKLAETEKKQETEHVVENADENVDKLSFKPEDAKKSPIPKCDCPEKKTDAECGAKNLESKVFNDENLEDWLDSVLDD